MKDIEEDGQNIDIPSGPRSLLDMDGHPANDSENYNDKNGAGNNAENDDNPSRTKSVRDIDGSPANDSDNDNERFYDYRIDGDCDYWSDSEDNRVCKRA